MVPANPAEAVGYYCGRIGAGLLGEPLNAFSNLAFVVGAAIAWRAWRSSPARDTWLPALIALLLLVGLGSFVFHSHPTRLTLAGDLLPIQVFGLAVLAYACWRYLRLQPLVVLGVCVAFVMLRQGWIAVSPRGALGGGITHIPSVLLLAVMGAALMIRGIRLWRYALVACAVYAAAILVRSLDAQVCRAFPLGLHWLWHLLTAATASLLVIGMARIPPGAPSQGRKSADMSGS